LTNEPDALWKYTYKGIARGYRENVDEDLIGDIPYRSALTNWGFHNNFKMLDGGGGITSVTDKPTFKWQAIWDSHQEWIVFTELVVTEGIALEGGSFDGERQTDIWAVHVESGELVQISNAGDAHLPLWQPVPTRP
jgi:hypothetical protein